MEETKMDAADPGRERPRRSATDLLQVAVEKEGDHARVAPSGKIDRGTVARLATALHEMAHDGGVRRLTVDLEGVTFLDSSGLRLLCSTASDASRVGFDFGVTRPSHHVRRLFVLTHVDQVVQVVER
jgi:anti-sigma B factor antagonist